MSRYAITGATGFIGKELSSVLEAQGHAVFKLSRKSESGEKLLPWHLGDRLPKPCEDADAVIHLACASLAEAGAPEESARRDLEGSRVLIDHLRRLRKSGRRIRFIFLSSQSAREGARNAYGRSKWAIESLLGEDDEIIVRPGLVYSDPPASVFATFAKIARLPVVPIVTTKPGLQPIHVRELAECIVQLAVMRRPPSLVKLGAIRPLNFKEALRATACRSGRKSPLLITLPKGPVWFAARLIDLCSRSALAERLSGLLGLEPMDTEPSLVALGRTLAPFAVGES
jgi:nucleoside-diphosphate-sugar epimerase